MTDEDNIRDTYRKETKENPYCSYNDDGGVFTDNYVYWLEKKIIELKADIKVMWKKEAEGKIYE